MSKVASVMSGTNNIEFVDRSGKIRIIKFDNKAELERFCSTLKMYNDTNERAFSDYWKRPMLTYNFVRKYIQNRTVFVIFGHHPGLVTMLLDENDYIRFLTIEEGGRIDNVVEDFYIDADIKKICTDLLGLDDPLISAASSATVKEEPKYSEHIKQYVRQRLGLEKTDTSKDSYIDTMSSFEVFESALEWEGICGYAYMIKSLIEDAYHITLS